MEVIGVDVGGTQIKVGVVKNLTILRSKIIETGQGRTAIINNIITSIEEIIDPKIKGIGVGCPGPADYQQGTIGNTPNLPLEGVNLKKILSRKFRLPVVINNDANCFVLGESLRLKKKNLIGVTLGSGIGGGIVINGEIYSGNGNAGEFGHCTIKFDGIQDSTGVGTLEAYLSGKGIKRRYGKSPLKLSNQEWADYGRLLGIALANLTLAFDPGTIVLGGRISQAFPKFKINLNQEIKKMSAKTGIEVKVISGRQNSGIIGAAHLAIPSSQLIGNNSKIEKQD